MGRLLQGRFQTLREVWVWILVGYVTSYVLAGIAMAKMPDDTEFSIMRTCVSKVGSFDAEYNPPGFLWFSASQVAVSLAMFGLVLYRHRRMSSALGPSYRMRILTTLFLIGIGGYLLTGLVPMGRPKLIGDFTWDNIHDVAAKVGFLCFGFGLFIESAVLYFKHRGSKKGNSVILPFHSLIKPYLLSIIAATCAVYFLLAWDIKRAQDPTLRWTGEGLYAFALWEWIMFAAAPLTVAGVALAWMRNPESASPENE
jgi:hypothetical protein